MMKKILPISVLLFGLLSSSYAYAVYPFATEVTQLFNKASSAVIEAKTTAMQAWDKSAWVQQLKGLFEELQKLQAQLNEIKGMRDDLMNTMSGIRDISSLALDNKSPENSKDSIDYEYAPKLPTSYTASDSFVGKASSSDSNAIRNSWKVAGSFTKDYINDLSKKAAEDNAKQIAIIQAMAQEAYMQANNRIKKINELKAKITGIADTNVKSKITSPDPLDWVVGTEQITIDRNYSAIDDVTGKTSTSNSNVVEAADSYKIGNSSGSEGGSETVTDTDRKSQNDLKSIADLQAQLQVQQALLINEQNKLAALAVMQQSQRDAYEQQKREIADYVINRSGDLTSILKYAGIAALQKASYSTVAGWYSATTE